MLGVTYLSPDLPDDEGQVCVQVSIGDSPRARQAAPANSSDASL